MENPPKLKRGDKVAVVSPSWAGPGIFPALQDQALSRIRDLLDLEPVEFPTTRLQGTPAERAADLMAAYRDPSIRAVFATIGGDDQITVLPHLDPAPFRADPKPYFGYSDNTNVLNWLWLHGVAGYHGGSTLVHLARGGAVDPEHLASLRAALFETTDLEITPVAGFTDEELSWTDPASLSTSSPRVKSPGFFWHRADRVVTAPTWGGSLEIVSWNLAANRWIGPVDSYAGSILLLETSEEMPSAEQVFRVLRNAGERGLLQQFPAVLVATAKASNIENRPPQSERAKFRDDQREAVLRALHTYSPAAMAVFGVDFGHTAPQWILPYGGRMTVDGPARRITAHF
ncbi:muramoyltetrapeptide carboxypeptidase LdcA involved in peptidoglycan recycling [Actinoplanes tereljensis]|uniref:LD-carboxypeptidase n=1 Tax=Paractinoplanes tereljensis TaxID=571912 RepID=A0A919TT66_9ACTN|nr:S66 peptidase family protein [Actinoplanes tereljensis]GIF19747.1 LD-carboxypeptidase [Actinoplanes tereljensis]